MSTQFHLSLLLSAGKKGKWTRPHYQHGREGRLVWPTCNFADPGHPALTHDWPSTPLTTLLMYVQKREGMGINVLFHRWHHVASLCLCLTYKVAIPLSQSCPLFCSSCQNCQTYLLPFRPSWRLKEQEKGGGTLSRIAPLQSISVVNNGLNFQMMPHNLISGLFYDLTLSAVPVADWQAFPKMPHGTLILIYWVYAFIFKSLCPKCNQVAVGKENETICKQTLKKKAYNVVLFLPPR